MAELIPLLINVSMGLVVLSLGLHTSLKDTLYLVERPALLARSILSMNVVMLVFALLLVGLFPLDPAVKIAIVALALSPVPPVLPDKQTHAFGNPADVISLLFWSAALSIVIVPLGTWILATAFSLPSAVPAAAVLPPLLITIIVPLIMGMLINHFAPEFAVRIGKWVAIAGMILLLACFLPILISRFPAFLGMLHNGAALALVAFSVVGVIVGHLLGGPNSDDRSVLALATATRHPGVAIAIAGVMFPDAAGAVILAAIWHLIISALVTIPYVKWRQRMHAGDTPRAQEDPP